MSSGGGKGKGVSNGGRKAVLSVLLATVLAVATIILFGYAKYVSMRFYWEQTSAALIHALVVDGTAIVVGIVFFFVMKKLFGPK